MLSPCKYCNSLHKAIEDQNFCSIKGDDISEVSSNAYYFKSNSLKSGEHISRLSIRTISDGYQRYSINGNDYILDKSKYLLVDEGERFESEISTKNPVEGILVAFDKSSFSDLSNFASMSTMKLLDNPFDSHQSNFHIPTQSSEFNLELQKMMINLRNKMLEGQQEKMAFSEIFYNIIYQILVDQRLLQDKIQSINSIKKSTKEEIYRRIKTGKEYMDNNLEKDLNLEKLSRASAMSQFHFLRQFSKFYHLTPHQYLTGKRIDKAKFLLKDDNLSLEEIISQIGFENKSSFGRLFKRIVDKTPNEYRSAAIK